MTWLHDLENILIIIEGDDFSIDKSVGDAQFYSWKLTPRVES